jgi:hypothetical protein
MRCFFDRTENDPVFAFAAAFYDDGMVLQVLVDPFLDVIA